MTLSTTPHNFTRRLNVALAIRDFSYMFTCARKLEDFSTLSRILTALTAIVSVFLSRSLSENTVVEATRLMLVLVLELTIASHFRGIRTLLASLKLAIFFIAIGALVYYLSYAVGWAFPEPASIFLGAITLVELLLAFSLLFQLLSLREWRRILSLFGFRKHAVLFSLVVSQIPVTIYYTSEAFTTIRLKYGGKRLYRMIVPLVLLSLHNARSILESHLLYGVSYESKLTVFKRRDLTLYSIIALFAAIFLALEFAIPKI